MGLFNWIFGKKEESSDGTTDALSDALTKDNHKTKVAPVSEVTNIPVPKGSTMVYESSVPISCTLGNLIFDKKYKEAVDKGIKLLEETPNDTGILINLMDAYFKGKETTAPDYLDKSTYYAKQAMLNGHNTGYAEERLAKNLDKAKLFHQSLQLYNLILDNKDFHFSSHGCGNSIDWNHRRESVLKKIDKALDTENDILFTNNEITQIIQSIKDNDDRERRNREKYDRINRELEETFRNGDREKRRDLLRELNNFGVFH